MVPKGKYVRTDQTREKQRASAREYWARRRAGLPALAKEPATTTALAIDETPRFIRNPADVLAVANHWLDDKRAELARAEQAVKALGQLKVPPARRRLAKERVRFLKRFVGALQSGYVPIPRFDAETLDLNVEELPAEALVAMAETKGKRLFDDVRYVTGAVPQARSSGRYDRSGRWTHRGTGGRDPLIVGVIRTPEHRIPPAHQWERARVIPSREEHFLIAWWRPEDTTDADLF